MASSQNGESSKKVTSSVQDVTEEKPAFGSRFLTDEADVWSQNAWDHVPPPDDQFETIIKSLTKQKLNPVSPEEKAKVNEKPAKHWDNFYKMNASNFFRNRKWLHNEFPELVAATKADAGPVLITEVGCGAGNSVFPLLSANQNEQLQIKAYDYSSHAVKLVQNNPLYTSPPVGTISAAVWDATSPNGIPSDITPGTIDLIILVFMLKPGGQILFRDYGRHDLTQLRFKGGRLLDENFYIRGDKTRVYFFELDELSLLFTGNRVTETEVQPTISTTEEDEDGNDTTTNSSFSRTLNNEDSSSPPLQQQQVEQLQSHEDQPLSPQPQADTLTLASIHPNLLSPLKNCPPHPLFIAEQLGIDRRLIVNRKRQLKMYRVWMQGKFRKL
ncbi:hypothetical protein D9613_007109 [Agrocybe pediades]|uniref:tRNA N(3)-methylcytidine methyltransferase n=1 Tax=Agrocybe pediades TaxID=84607 RepID=A0A8H4QH71_9AGAR|nr:hypothetical protein D9613_007109 [Agrocybe pediades]